MGRQTANTIVPYTPNQMYDLVVDMDHYPDFLPWCAKARKFDVEPDQFMAEMTFTFRGFRETFRTLDRVIPGERIQISLVSGPFSKLENEWRFSPVANGTRVDFMIDFQFKSRLIDAALGPFFSHATREMVTAFRKRADQVYHGIP